MDLFISALLAVVFVVALIVMSKRFGLVDKKPVYALIGIVGAACIYCMLHIKNMDLTFVLIFCLIEFVMLLLSLWDIKEKQIPTYFIYILFSFCAVMMLVNPYCKLVNNLITGGFMTIALLIVYKLSKDKIGLGDVEVMLALGFAFGYPQVFSIVFVAMFIAMLFGIGLIAFKKVKIGAEIPFIPFLLIGITLNIINF